MYEVYTDGSCLGNPGRGGWGVISKDITLSGNLRNTTNNVMEMTAVAKALEACINYGHDHVRIYTDSNYVKNGITQWIHNWKKNGWKTSLGEDVKNKELWMQIDTLREKIKIVEWEWVKAHNGNPLNEEVDTLAREAAGAMKKQKFYAVVKGCTPGIYTTWDEAKTQVNGYPGAIYKSFKTEEEAEEFMNTPVKERIYLSVPYEEKDRVKSMGARWDPTKKKWWVQVMKPELEIYVE